MLLKSSVRELVAHWSLCSSAMSEVAVSIPIGAHPVNRMANHKTESG